MGFSGLIKFNVIVVTEKKSVAFHYPLNILAGKASEKPFIFNQKLTEYKS